MKKENLLYVDYDLLKEDPIFPKSVGQVFKQFFKSNWENFKKKFPMSLIIPLAMFAIFGLFNIIFLAVIEDTFNLHFNSGSILISNIKAYIMPGMIWSNSNFAGFTHISHNVNNLYVVIPFMMIFMYLLKSSITNIFTKGKFKELKNNLKEMKINKKTYIILSENKFSKYYLYGLIVAFALGLIIKNPLTIFLLGIMFLLSFIKNNESNILMLVATLKAARNIEKDRDEFVNFGSIALTILGLAYGFLTYFVLVIVIWFVFNYSIFARVAFSMLFIGLFVYLLLAKNPKIKVAKIASLVIFFVSILMAKQRIGLADDGGWTESGANIIDWLANAGTKIIAALGLSGSGAAAVGWITNTVIGSIAGYFNLGPLLQMGGLVAGFGKPSGSMAANLTFSQAAIKAAFGSMGPLGDQLSNAVSGINDALSGGTGSNSSGSSGSSGSSSSSGGSSGGDSGQVKDLGDEYRKKDIINGKDK